MLPVLPGRWHRLRETLAGLRAVAPTGMAAMAGCGAEVATQLDSIRSKEGRLNVGMADILGGYRKMCQAQGVRRGQRWFAEQVHGYTDLFGAVDGILVLAWL